MGPGCDIYSLGVMLYQLRTGRVPFQGDLLQVLSQIAVDNPKPPSTYRKEIDQQLDRICLKAMAKKPENRFSSMAEFAKYLATAAKAPAEQKSTAAAKGKNEIEQLFGQPGQHERPTQP